MAIWLVQMAICCLSGTSDWPRRVMKLLFPPHTRCFIAIMLLGIAPKHACVHVRDVCSVCSLRNEYGKHKTLNVLCSFTGLKHTAIFHQHQLFSFCFCLLSFLFYFALSIKCLRCIAGNFVSHTIFYVPH